MCEEIHFYLEKIRLCWMIWCLDEHSRVRSSRRIGEVINTIKQLDPTTETNLAIIDFGCILNFTNVVNLNDYWHATQWIHAVMDWIMSQPTTEKRQILTTIKRIMDHVLGAYH